MNFLLPLSFGVTKLKADCDIFGDISTKKQFDFLLTNFKVYFDTFFLFNLKCFALFQNHFFACSSLNVHRLHDVHDYCTEHCTVLYVQGAS